MDMDHAEELFINEAYELLQEMEQFLLEIDNEEAGVGDHIAAIFRAAHTIKGSAGLFGFDDIVAFTHKVENVLDAVRSGKQEFTEDLIELMLGCHGHMQMLVSAISDKESEVDKQEGLQLIERLNVYLKESPNEPVVEDSPAEETDTESIGSSEDYWVIEVEYGEDVFRDGMDPLSHINYLDNMGTIHDCKLTTHFPEKAFDPEACYLSVILAYETNLTKADIEEVFEFIQENSKITISTPLSYKERFKDLPENSDPIGEILLETGAITERELNQALTEQRSATVESSKPIGEHIIDSGAVDKEILDAALKTQSKQAHKKPQDLRFLKVDARKLDRLISLIGEMVTTGSAIDVEVKKLQDENLDEVFSTMVGLIEQIRDRALQLRMVQVGETFNRLKRIVRDVSKELGKEIKLTITGAETELDKTMVEKLSDPLMHIVRNAIDHGIEGQEDRAYKGKSKEGHLQLNAFHESGAVVIEVVDDGAGLNQEKILAKAIENGVIKAGEELSPDRINMLIFEPGFSTADQVTNLSGRGVGMDVVKRNIDELKGQITISTKPNQGSRFRIRLPLTLAIIDGFEVSVGDAHLVIPQNMIQECLTFDKSVLEIDRNYVNLRNEVLPFVDVSEVLRTEPNPKDYRHLVVVKYADKKAGLVVDALFGELQAVIKPMSEIFRSMKGIGGSTILGTGDVGFILDVPQLIEYACSREESRFSKSPFELLHEDRQG